MKNLDYLIGRLVAVKVADTFEEYDGWAYYDVTEVDSSRGIVRLVSKPSCGYVIPMVGSAAWVSVEQVEKYLR